MRAPATPSPASAASDFADRSHGTTAGSAPGADSVTSSTAGAASRITWAFVPEIPNEDTPARCGRSTSGQARASVTSSTAPDFQSTSLVGASTCSVLGTTPARIAMTILITPPPPAAACASPMFDFSYPSSSGSVP